MQSMEWGAELGSCEREGHLARAQGSTRRGALGGNDRDDLWKDYNFGSI